MIPNSPLLLAADTGGAGGTAGSMPELQPDELLILPVRGFVLFPGVVMPVVINRPGSVAAAQTAVRQGRPVGILMQRDADAPEANPGNLHRMGVVANILRYVTAPDGTHHLICQGEQRFYVDSFVREQPALVARVRRLEEPDEQAQDIQARFLHLKGQATEAIELLPQSPPELLATVSNATSPSALADMVAAYTPALAEKPFTLGSTYDDGLGIRLGASAGAELKHMDEPFITAPFYPPSSLMTGVLVNNRGERFVAEDCYHSRTSQFVMEQPEHTAYLIVDSEHVEYPKFPLVPLLDGFETIADLETALALPPGSAAATLERYNKMAEAGEDLDFHKAAEWLAPQDTGPWAVFDLRLGKAMYAGFTLGGIRVSVDGEALRPDGAVISGLYAAGACASNIAQDGKGYCSGTQLGEGSFFGRRAGQAAAARGSEGSA